MLIGESKCYFTHPGVPLKYTIARLFTTAIRLIALSYGMNKLFLDLNQILMISTYFECHSIKLWIIHGIFGQKQLFFERYEVYRAYIYGSFSAVRFTAQSCINRPPEARAYSTNGSKSYEVFKCAHKMCKSIETEHEHQQTT